MISPPQEIRSFNKSELDENYFREQKNYVHISKIQCINIEQVIIDKNSAN